MPSDPAGIHLPDACFFSPHYTRGQMTLTLSDRQTRALSRLLAHLQATYSEAETAEPPPFSAEDLRHLLPLLKQIKKPDSPPTKS